MPVALTRWGTRRRRLSRPSRLTFGRGRERTGVVLGRGQTTGLGPFSFFVGRNGGRVGICWCMLSSRELREAIVDGVSWEVSVW